jgi:hypothetical protein
MRLVMLLLVSSIGLLGCTAPDYLSVPPALPNSGDRRLAPSWPELAVVRDQHLEQLRTELRAREEALARAAQARLDACQQPEAARPNTVAYERCQLQDQLYERLRQEVASIRTQYLRGVSGAGGPGR